MPPAGRWSRGGRILRRPKAAIFESPAQSAPDRLPGRRSSPTHTSARSRGQSRTCKGVSVGRSHDRPSAALTQYDASMAFWEYSRSRCSSPSNASGVSSAVLNHAVQYSTIGEQECHASSHKTLFTGCWEERRDRESCGVDCRAAFGAGDSLGEE